MSTSINWPATLPIPSISGYQIKPTPNTVRTEVETGPARQRRFSTATRDVITVQFVATLWEQAMFEGWHRNVAMEGAVWFNMNLLGGTGIASYEARFMIGQDVTYAPQSNGQVWLISCALEIRDRPILSAADLAILLPEDGNALLAAINAIDLLLNTQLWT